MAAGAADLQLNSAALIAAGRKKGVPTKAVAGAALGYYGWYLMVKADSKITKVSELEGKKVGITAGRLRLRRAGALDHAGPQGEVHARAARRRRAGAEPAVGQRRGGRALLAAVLQDHAGEAGRSLIDFGAEVQPHLTGLWIAPDKFIAEKPQVVQKAMNALFGAVVFLQDKANRAEAVKLIAEIDEIAPQVAEAELDGNLVKMSTTGEMTEEWIWRARSTWRGWSA